MVSDVEVPINLKDVFYARSCRNIQTQSSFDAGTCKHKAAFMDGIYI
jgi:hypothetical protein